MSFKIEMLVVQRDYLPVPVQPSKCALSRIQSRTIDHSLATLNIITYHPSFGHEGQRYDGEKSLRVHSEIVEKSKILFNSSWVDRIRLIEQIFGNTLIFSLSIVPTDPTQKQTLYVKRVPLQRPDDLPLDEYSVYSQKQTTAHICQGFIKPYAGYSHRGFEPEQDLSRYTRYSLEEAQALQGPHQSLLGHFANDIHARAIGLLLLNPQEGRVDRMFILKD